MYTVMRMALLYARSGFHVIPIGERSKAAQLADWPRRASRDEWMLRRWFSSQTDANLGLLMGRGVFCLDVDPERGGEESLADLVGRRRLPETTQALTGSGGRHLLFRLDGTLPSRDGFRPGLDLKARDSYIVVEPSVHPCGKEYVWLRKPFHILSPCPRWLLREIRPEGLVPFEAPLDCSLALDRPGDAGALVAELILRYPVGGHGQRNDLMVRAIASLLGRGYPTCLVVEVVGRWWQHFYRQKMIRTPLDCRLIEQAIRSILRPGSRFRVGSRGLDHLHACAEIVLTDDQLRQLDTTVDLLQRRRTRAASGQGRAASGAAGSAILPRPPHSKRVTRIEKRLCESVDERAFVEAILVHAIHKRATGGLASLKMTHDQLRAIAGQRHPGITWSNQQIVRLKAKYVRSSGPDAAPATRFELLRELVKGHRAPGQKVGTPSEYQVTGLAALLVPGPSSAHSA